MKRLGMWVLLAISIIVPVLLVAVAFGMCGVGHGDCRLMIVFPAVFPYATLFSVPFPNQIGVLLILALGQFPLYVIALAWSRGTPKQGLVRIVIPAAHAVAAVIAFIAWS